MFSLTKTRSATGGEPGVRNPLLLAADIERVTSDDLMSLATDRGAVPMQVGAVLILDTPAEYDPATLIAAIGRRVPAVPRLRQRLVRPGILFGRPVWIDDPRFRIDDHVSIAPRPAASGVDGLLTVASELVATRLLSDRPLWAALIVPEMGDGHTGLVFVFHHVVADGIAGLAILAALADGSPDAPESNFPQSAPTRAALARDAARGRLVAIRLIPRALARLGEAMVQVGPSLRARASASSLNQPTGERRHLATVDCDLAAVRDVAHANGATINDVVLSAITGALHHLLTERGEVVDKIVISVLFSSRRTAATGSLGNQSGAIPIRLPASGDPLERLRAVANITTAEKLSTRGVSAAVLGPLFRVLARIGMYQRFVDHQRIVNTFVSNLKGPETALSLGGFPVVDIVPLTTTSGNITVLFAVLSYAGKLTITIVSDPATCPDLDALRHALVAELAALSATRR